MHEFELESEASDDEQEDEEPESSSLKWRNLDKGEDTTIVTGMKEFTKVKVLSGQLNQNKQSRWFQMKTKVPWLARMEKI